MDIKYNNEKYEIKTEINSDQITAIINGETKKYAYKRLSDNIASYFFENGYKNVFTAEDDNHFYVAFDGDNYIFDKVKDEEKSFGGDNTDSSDRIEIKPPMPGSIVKVLVEVGQKVSEGEPLILVEAMKMETSLFTTIDGVVTEVNVKAGEQVDSNQVLVVVEKEVKDE